MLVNCRAASGDQVDVKNAFKLSTLADQLHSDVRSLVIAALLIGGLILWFAIGGRTDRVIYRGIDQAWAEPGIVHLKTDPAGNYVVERNAEFAAMKVGCLYDLNYNVAFGRHQRNDRIKTVRRVTLVGCQTSRAGSGRPSSMTVAA